MDGRRPRPGPYNNVNDLHRHVNELKQKLKPFRNKHTTEYKSKITKSSTLPRHMDNIEQLLAISSSCQDIQRSLQNAMNTITSIRRLTNTPPKLNITDVDLTKMFKETDFETTMINLKMNCININSPATINFNSMSRGNISVPAIPASEVNHVNIHPSPNKSNTESSCNISSPANAANEMNHVNNGLSAYYNNKVSGGETESSEIVTKKLENMQL